MYMHLKKIMFTTALTLSLAQVVFAQGQPRPVPIRDCNLSGSPSSTLRSPYVPGSTVTPPFLPAPEGQPPAIGDGPTPSPVTPGMGGPPTLLPWVPTIPANQIDRDSSGVPLPFTPAIATPPGVLGPLVTPFIPAPPSTPGVDPGSLTAPFGSFNPARQIHINPQGGIPGRGGFCTTIPTVRRGGQESHQWELRGRNSALAGIGGDGSQDEVTLLGPLAGWGAPFGVPTGNGLRNSSIDLAGGQRFKVRRRIRSTGTSLQEYGLSVTRDNPIRALRARQAYEYGQGWRRIPLYSSKSTDFGFPYRQFDPANVTAQKRDQLLLPRAVITNF